jgi:hypothetical protein
VVTREIGPPMTYVTMPSSTPNMMPMQQQTMMMPNSISRVHASPSPPPRVALPPMTMHPNSGQWQFIPNIETVPPVIQPPSIPVQQMAPQSMVHY